MEPQLRAGLSMALWYQGKLDSADVEIRAAIREAPREVTLRSYHGALLSDMARYDEALEEYRTAIALDPNHPDAQAIRREVDRLEATRKAR